MVRVSIRRRYYRHSRCLSMVLLAVCVAACAGPGPVAEPAASPSVLPLVNRALFAAAPSVIETQALFSLTEQQQQHFLDHFHSDSLAELPPHKRVYDYIERFAHQFSYLGATHTASDALAKTEGNCLSLAIVTTALARLANVPIGYQLVDSMPVFERRGGVILQGRHVRSLLHHQTQTQSKFAFSFSASTLVIDYFPDKSNRLVRGIPEAEYVAMYYRNLAAEALVNDDLSAAFAHAEASLKQAPLDAGSIGLLAILHRRADDVETAESIYRFGIDHADDDPTLLSNYRTLLRAQGRDTEADALTAKLRDYDAQHPYYWLGLAENLLVQGESAKAEHHYQRAVDLAPYLHEAHFGLAKARYLMGDRSAAYKALSAALRNANAQEDRGLYQAKLDALSE